MYVRRISMSFNQKEYIGNYNKDNYKLIPIRIRKDNVDITNKLESVPSVNSYILSLIDNDIHRNTLTIKQIKERVLPILAKHNIHEVYLFGSYARGEANNKSDVDIYCEAGDINTFIEQGYLEDELEEALGKEVDLIFIGSTLDEHFRRQLEEDKIRIK